MKPFFLGLILLVSSSTFSQLDSIDFSMSFVTNPTFTVGLDEISQQGDVFQVNVSLNTYNLDNLGALTVLVYDQQNSSLSANITLSREQILSGTYTNNNQIVFNFPYLDTLGNYRVIVEIQNVQQAYLPSIEKIFPTN